MHSAPSVSLILVTYNSRALLPDFFASLAETSYPYAELLVADNASTDGTPAYVAAQPHAVRLLASRANLGFGRACNRAAAIASGELLVFLNPDVTFSRDWLATLAAHMAAQPSAAIVCPETLYPGELRDARAAGGLEQVAAVPGSAMMVRRAAWEQLGGFDERIFLYWEDTELCWRAWLQGWQVLVDHDAYVFHARGASGGGRGWAAEAARNGLYTYLKLMRWRRVARYAARLACHTLLVSVARRGNLWPAWRDNAAQLGHTLAQRRTIHAQARIDIRQLEHMIDRHIRQQRTAARRTTHR